MKKYILRLFAGLMLFSVTACSDDDLGPSIFDTSERDRTEIDKWLQENYIDPYNIEIVYKWHDSYTGLAYNLVAPKEDKAWELAKALKVMWIEPYVDEAGETFFNKLSPKQVAFIGSARYNSDGKFTEGASDGGRMIVIYSVNDYSSTDSVRLKSYMETIHQQFASVTIQEQEYPKEYESISGGYVEQWKNVKKQEAYDAGFISPYAMSEPDVDFTEMVSKMLSNNREQWEALLNMPATDEAKQMLQDKLDMVLTYYRETWDLDLYSLQEKSEKAVGKVLHGTNE